MILGRLLTLTLNLGTMCVSVTDYYRKTYTTLTDLRILSIVWTVNHNDANSKEVQRSSNL